MNPNKEAILRIRDAMRDNKGWNPTSIASTASFLGLGHIVALYVNPALAPYTSVEDWLVANKVKRRSITPKKLQQHKLQWLEKLADGLDDGIPEQ